MPKNTRPEEWKTMKVWVRTHRALRIIAAHRGETISATLDRLVSDELARLTTANAEATGERGA